MKTPYPFQQEAVTHGVNAPGFLIADECGLGKTITALEIVKAARDRNELLADMPEMPWRGLVICPPALIQQWIDAITDQDPGNMIMISNRIPRNYADLDGWLIMSCYDLHAPTVVVNIANTVWDTIIFDEAHRIKNRQTKMAVAAKHIPASRKIALTGTPMEATAADIWSILNWCNPDAFPSYWSFVGKYIIKTPGYMDHWKLGGAKDPEEFGRVLAPFMIRRTKEEVAPQLPEKIIIDMHVPLLPDQLKLYDLLKRSKDILVTLPEGDLVIPNVLALVTKMQQVSSWPALINPERKLYTAIESAKINWLFEFLTDHPIETEPCVIFTRFRDLAIELSTKLDCDMVVGGHRGNVGGPLLVGTIDAMGEGLNLQWAKNVVFMDGHWSSQKMTQAIDRVHRIDIKEPKNLYMLWSTHEDKLIYDAYEKKMSESEFVYYYIRGSQRT